MFSLNLAIESVTPRVNIWFATSRLIEPYPVNDSSLSQRRDIALRINQQCYDQLAATKAPLCKPAGDDEMLNPLQTVDPLGWLGPTIVGSKVLCLAAGGGRHSALYANAGADVTVVDISPAMLELDRLVARERRLSIQAIQTSMDQLGMIKDAYFDIVVHPVSTCYLPNVAPVFKEVARVLRPGGIYVSQHKSPISLQASCDLDSNHQFAIMHTYYREDPIPDFTNQNSVTRRLRERGAVEYLHRFEQLVGGICRAGMVIEDLIEPVHADSESEPGSFGHRGRFIAPYLRIKAVKRSTRSENAAKILLSI